MKGAVGFDMSGVFIDKTGNRFIWDSEEGLFLQKLFYKAVQKKEEGVMMIWDG